MLLICIHFSPLLPYLSTRIYAPGDNTFNLAILTWNYRVLTTGDWANYFSPPYFYPYKDVLAFSEMLLGQTAFFAPLYCISGNNVLAFNLTFLAIYLLGAVGLYSLLTARRLPFLLAILGGMIYVFDPIRSSQIPHFQMISCAFIPWIILFLQRLQTALPRPLAILYTLGLALLLFIQGLSSWYIFLFLLVGLAVFVPTTAIISKVPRKRIVLQCSGILLGSLLLLPFALQYARAASRYGVERSLGDAAWGAARIHQYFIPQSVTAFYSKLMQSGTFNAEHALFPGFSVLAVLLAAAAFSIVAMRRSGLTIQMARHRFIVPFVAVGGTAFVFSLGPRVYSLPEPIYVAAYRIIPLFRAIRVPSRFSVLIILALSVLVPYILWKGTDRLSSSRARACWWGFGVLFAAEAMLINVPIGNPQIDWAAELEGLLTRVPRGKSVLIIPSASSEDSTIDWVYDAGYMLQFIEKDYYLVNGYSGYVPPERRRAITEAERQLLACSPDFINSVKRLHADYVVVHKDRNTGRDYHSAFAQCAGAYVGNIIVKGPSAFVLEVNPDKA